jgi:hypothetical protein
VGGEVDIGAAVCGQVPVQAPRHAEGRIWSGPYTVRDS